MYKTCFKILFPVFIAILIGSGCVSSEVPQKLILSADEQASMKQSPVLGPVLVKTYKHPAYSESLAHHLANTELFEKVFEEDNMPENKNIAYIAEVNKQIYGTATFPFWTLISLGIIPSYINENFGTSFYLTPIDHPEKRQAIEVRGKSMTVLGWWALVLNCLPDRTFSLPQDTEIFKYRLKFEISKALDDKKTGHPLSRPSSLESNR